MSKRVAILGHEGNVHKLAGQLHTRANRFELMGRIQPPGETACSGNGVTALGYLDELENIINLHQLDYVVVAKDGFSAAQYDWISSICKRMRVKLYRTADIFGAAAGDLLVVNGLPLVSVKSVEFSDWGRIVKRILDVGLGIVLSTVFLPIMGLVALAIRTESPGPVFFHQIRRGKGGRHFKMWKLRSMTADAELGREVLEEQNETDGILFKVRHDPRVTKVGRLLRRWSLDETPQIFNVLRGDMSLVGPRPLPISDVEAHLDDPNLSHWIVRREDVTPGITGLWQVRGRSDVGFEEMLALDIHYVKNWSLRLDCTILMRTIPAVLLGRGAY
jgi:exopolysaccharide biosynthesis polyprenyl glycosylphosphotransferase